MTFRTTGIGILRASRHPLALALPALPTDDNDLTGWRDWLNDTVRDRAFADAVALASPALTGAVANVLGDHSAPPREVHRVARSLLRYALRARYRATPFGLFTRTAPVRLATTASVPPDVSERFTVRPDGLWLDAMLDVLHQNLQVVDRLRVVTDPTHTMSGEHVVVPHLPGVDRPEEVQVRTTDALLHLLFLVSEPATVADTVDKLIADYPAVERATVLEMVARLIRSRVLHSNLRPPATAPDPLGHVLGVLDASGAARVDGVALLVEGLREIHDLLARHLSATATERPFLRARAAARMAQIAEIKRDALTLDAHTPEPVMLPEAVATETAEALAVMARITPDPDGTAVWSDYRKQFVERYSFSTLVPLLDLVDPVAGLGFPGSYRDTRWPAPEARLTARDEYLLDRVQQITLDRGDELSLTEDDLTALHTAEPTQVWASSEATLTLRSPSIEAMNAGKWTAVVDGLAPAAGVLIGRFLPLLGDNEQERFVRVHRGLPTLDPDAVRVQVCAPPLRRRVQNVARSVPVADELLPVGEYVEGNTMHLGDLAVGATRSRMYLVHLPSGRRVEPFVMNAVEPTTVTHPMVRFLYELPRSHAARLVPFDWGAAANLPFLPRVRVGRIIMTPARWRLTTNDLTGEGIDAWRARWRVPHTVYLGDGDQRLRLDLSVPAHQDLLVRQVEQGTTVTLSEAAPDGDSGWLGHTAQVTLSFTAQQGTAAAPEHLAGRVLARRADVRIPGASTAVLLRIDTLPGRAPDLFAAGLRDLLEDPELVDYWWFTRYNDHAPHLRIRVAMKKASQYGDLAAKFGVWATDAVHDGRISGISWIHDRPETGRYGTGMTLTAAERVFAADSRAALAQEQPQLSRDERDALGAASLVDIAVRFLGDREMAAQFLTGHIGRGIGTAPTRRVRDLALSLWTPGPDRTLSALTGGGRVAAAWHERGTYLNAYADALTSTGGNTREVLSALLHMHHVRAWGPDVDHEHTMRHAARSIALSLLARHNRSER